VYKDVFITPRREQEVGYSPSVLVWFVMFVLLSCCCCCCCCCLRFPHPSQAEVIKTLKGYIQEQVALMERGLALWPKVCPAEFNPMLAHLRKQLGAIQEEVKAY